MFPLPRSRVATKTSHPSSRRKPGPSGFGVEKGAESVGVPGSAPDFVRRGPGMTSFMLFAESGSRVPSRVLLRAAEAVHQVGREQLVRVFRAGRDLAVVAGFVTELERQRLGH